MSQFSVQNNIGRGGVGGGEQGNLFEIVDAELWRKMENRWNCPNILFEVVD